MPAPARFFLAALSAQYFLCSFSLLGIVPAVFSLPPLPTAAARGGISGGIWVYERLRNRATKVMSKLRGKNFVLRILFECMFATLTNWYMVVLIEQWQHRGHLQSNPTSASTSYPLQRTFFSILHSFTIPSWREGSVVARSVSFSREPCSLVFRSSSCATHQAAL